MEKGKGKGERRRVSFGRTRRDHADAMKKRSSKAVKEKRKERRISRHLLLAWEKGEFKNYSQERKIEYIHRSREKRDLQGQTQVSARESRKEKMAASFISSKEGSSLSPYWGRGKKENRDVLS